MSVRVVIAAVLLTLASAEGMTQAPQDYRPKLAVPESMQPFLKHLEPGDDGFAMESEATELDARLEDLSKALRENVARIGDVAKGLLDPGFRGGRRVSEEGRDQKPVEPDGKSAENLERQLKNKTRTLEVE